ncbi:MAG: DUF4401 domain-containing protein [Betaproteobacteria bacterium]|nr:DUF4401 domain-containing protein [Betaproteobacteria bacterium]
MKIFPSRGNPEIFWQTLSDAGLVQGEMPVDSAKAHGDGSPWFVKVMLGVAAWLSSCLFLFFIAFFMGREFENEWVRAILGTIACTLAVVCFRKCPSSAFVDQILFILALLGQVLLVSVIWFGGSSWTESYVPCLLTALFGVAVLVAIPYLPNRFLSASVALTSLYFAVLFWVISFSYTGMPFKVAELLALLFMSLCLALLAVVLRYQWRLPRLWPVVALVLSLVPFFIAGMQDITGIRNSMLLGGMGGSMWTVMGASSSNGFEVFGRVSLVVAWLGIVYALLRRGTAKPLSLTNSGAWLFAILLAAGTWPVPMALFALTVYILGFSQRDKLLEGIGVVQLLWSVGYYYYSLEDILLFKSLMLTALGAVLLLLYAFSRYLLPKTGCNEGEKG